MIRSLPRLLVALLTGLLLLSSACHTVQIKPRPGKKLAAGEFEWEPRRSTSGPVLIVVSLDDQTSYVYRNGTQIGRSTITLAPNGGSTTTGVFTIPPRREAAESGDPWTGTALLTGDLPADRGTLQGVRLPVAFSEKLFDATTVGATVVITRKSASPAQSAQPVSVLLSSDVQTRPEDVAGEGEFWDPALSDEGPVALLLSVEDKTIYVYRSGMLIGKSNVTILPGQDSGAQSAVFLMLEGELPGESEFVPGVKQRPWAVLSLDGGAQLTDPVAELRKRLQVPKAFTKKVYPLLQPGALLIVTRKSVAPKNRPGADFPIFGPGE